MDFNAVCRTCLTTEELNDIFMGSAEDRRYSAAVFITAGIKVDKDDGLPQQMCARCISFTNASLKFRKQCKDAETRLLQVKNECNGAAETYNSGAADSEDFNEKDMLLELKSVEDGDVTIKSEADSEVEDNGFGALTTTEEDPLELKPADGAGAAPERARARPGERPRCNTSHQQQLQLSSCFVRLERFPIEDLRRNLHTCETCLMTFDRESNLRNHSCTNSLEESNFIRFCDETANMQFKCDICGKRFVKKRQIIRHLAAHNVKQGGGKLLQNSSDVAKFSNTEGISYSVEVSKTRFRSPSVSAIHTGETLGPCINFTCDVCSKDFSHKQNLIRHIRKLHRAAIDNMTDKYICDICKKRFRRLSLLNVHMRVHKRQKEFTCDVCKKQFTQRGTLTRHRRIHTGVRSHCCSVCNKQFTDKSDLTSHMRIHTGEKLFSCDICGKKCVKKNNLIRHIKIHTGEKPFSCDVCKKQFALRSNLTRHRRIHTGVKSHCCSVCNKQYAEKSDLTYHMRMHTGEKLFSCDICGKKCVKKCFLITHMRIHTGERPFSCDVCKKQFAQRSGLKMHRLIHTGELYSCSVCSRQFTEKRLLTRHMTTHTGEKSYSCDVCKMNFARKDSLTRHLIIHTGEKPFHCDVFKKQFKRSSGLNSRRLIHTAEKPFSSSVCNKQFVEKAHLTRHIKTHTGEKSYSCDVCKKNFSRKDNLTRHLKIHTN